MQGIRSAFDVGRDEFKVTGLVPYFRKIEIKYDQLAASTYDFDIPIQARTLILGVAARIDTAFAGGTPTLDIGDGSNADCFIDSTNSDIDPTSAGAVANSQVIAANAFAKGLYYASAGVVKVTGAADLTDGKVTVLIQELQTADGWRDKGDIGQR